MENAIAEKRNASMPAREIGVITAEIKDICRQAQSMALIYAVEIGRRLEEAKQALPHGAWGDWLKNEVDFSQSTANNYMRLFGEYGSAQISLFGASVNSQSIANLSYSKALQLLAVPSEEREAFAEEVGAEALSVKELKEAIDERNRALDEAETAKKRQSELEARLAELEEKEDAAAEAEEEAKQAAIELEKARCDTEALRAKLAEAKKNPKIPQSTLDGIKAKAKAEAAEAAEAKNKAELEEAARKAEEAEKRAIHAETEAATARKSLEEVQKQLKTANPQITAFKTLFDSMQTTVAKLRTTLDGIRGDDPETAAKLADALKVFFEKVINV